jgi:hypothetical protein
MDAAERFGSFDVTSAWSCPVGQTPPYPHASNARAAAASASLARRAETVTANGSNGHGVSPELEVLREAVRRLVAEELASLNGASLDD